MIWPIIEKTQRTTFRKKIFATLTELENKKELPTNTVRLSLLQTCSGPKFYQLLSCLSSLALKKLFEREFPEKYEKKNKLVNIPNLDSNNFEYASKILKSLKLHFHIESNKFSQKIFKISNLQNFWNLTSKKITERHHTLSHQYSVLFKQLSLLKSKSEKKLKNEEEC